MTNVLNMVTRKVGLSRDDNHITAITADDEKRRDFMNHIHVAAQGVQSATTRVQLAIAEVGSALDALHVAFVEFDRVSKITAHDKSDAEIALEAADGPCTTLESACTALRLQLSELRTTEQDGTDKCLQGEVHEPLQRLYQYHREVDALRHASHRSAKVLEAAKAEVVSKEKEYQGKGRPLTESKLYPQLTQSLLDATSSHDAATVAYRGSCDHLMGDSLLVAAQCFQAAIYRIGSWSEGMADRLGGVVSLCNR
jgi:hypothetical protein